MAVAAMSGRTFAPTRSSSQPIMMPPMPPPMNCSEKARDGTSRGQPNSRARSFIVTAIRYRLPDPMKISVNDAVRT